MSTLVLLPGMDGTGDLFQPLLEALGTSLATVVIAYPTAKPLTYDELEVVVRAQLPKGSYALLGESFSGPIAISIAATMPQGLQAVVLSCSFASSPRPHAAWAASLLSLPLPIPPLSVLSTALLGRFSTSPLRGSRKRALSRVAPSVLRHRLAAALRVNVGVKLARIKVPLLYLQASSDRVVPNAAATEVQSTLPGTKVQVISGPHLLLQSRPAESARAIQEFLGKVENAA